MKKPAFLLSCLLLLTVLFSGCKSAQEKKTAGTEKAEVPLRLCVDMGDTTPVTAGSTALALEGSISTIELYHKSGQGGPEKIELEIIPPSGAERESALTRIRTEIMSGGGPDIFIAVCPNPSSNVQPLFPFPEKAMASRYFLPLDEYLKKAQFTDWDKLEPSIMNAGRSSEEQLILPMAFDLLLTYFRQEDAKGYDPSTSWQDVITGDDPVLSAAAAPARVGDYLDNNWFPVVFNEYVDYDTESLLITEDELFQTVKETGQIKNEGKAPHYSAAVSKTSFSIDMVVDYASWMNGIDFKDDMTMVPLYNREGGATAMVKAYCAINRNTAQPDNAFLAADYFLSESVQAKSSLYSAWNLNSMITDTEYIKGKMTGSQAQEFSRVLEQITCVRYWTPLDAELADIIYMADYKDWDEETLREVVPEAYAKMQMMLSES